MHTVSINDAMKDLPGLINRTIQDIDETIIVSDHGSVVVIDQEEWESIQETLLLLKDKKSLKALLESHKKRDENQEIDAKTVAEALYDLQDKHPA
ncbi:MAG: type II toxin-antitoxin system prevent-host-death family antitoxin [Candidatus Aminicenantes bacterium]|nr:type II toxin-antitoxin system prevent-host-death family antitoxin [Candidatus Aminicenantes bacterium]